MTPPATAVRSSGAALALLVTTQFVLVLDSTIVGVALPSIARDLDLAQEDLSWVNNAYVLVFGGFLMLGGRLADLAGRRRVFVAGLLLFTLASLAGGLAPTPGVLIACRAVQGLASALVAPAALSLLMTVFPDGTPQEKARRNRALGVYGAVSGAGGAAGMVLGGLLTDGFGWEAVFYVNVPIGVAGALLAPVLLPPGRAGERGGGFDLAGATTVTAGLALLVYVLVGTERNGWASAQTLGLGGLAVALLAAFAWIETRSGQPLVPLGIFRRRTLRGANLVGALIPMGVIPSIFFLTLYTQQVLGFSPLASGLALAPLALSVVLAATTVGRFLARLGLRLATAAGALLVTCGLLWASRISGGSFLLEQLGPEILIGLGGGTVWVTATVAATSDATEQEAGLASGLFNTSNQIGAALGLAVLAAVATAVTGATVNQATLTEGYGTALLGGTAFAVLALLSALLLLPGRETAAGGGVPAPEEVHAR